MTAQAGTEVYTGIDWQLLEDSFMAQACEFKQHGKHPRHPDSGPAAFYFRGACVECKGVSPIHAICAAIAAHIKSGDDMTCSKCGESTTPIILLMEPIQ